MFEIDVFRFEDAGDRVYLYCDVIVCFAGVSRSICNDHCEACGVTARRRRAQGSYDRGSSPYYLKIGPFQIQDSTAQKEQGILMFLYSALPTFIYFLQDMCHEAHMALTFSFHSLKFVVRGLTVVSHGYQPTGRLSSSFILLHVVLGRPLASTPML